MLGAARARETAGVDVEIAYEDTVADPKTAIAAYQSLTSRNPFKVFFTYGSGVGIALSSLANRDQRIQVGLATASPAYRTPDDFTFRNFPSAELEAQFLAKYILHELKQRSIAMIKIDNDYGVGTAAAFRKEFERLGGSVGYEESVEPKQTDFRSTIMRLRQSNPAVIYIASYPAEGALFLKQARQLGIQSQFVASVAILGSKDFVSLAGAGAEGLLVSSSTPVFLESSEPEVKHFVDLYRKQFGEVPSVQAIYGARAFDAVMVVARAYRNCGRADSICMRDELFKVQNYRGAGGEISFDRYGDVSNAYSMMQFRNGQFRGVAHDG